MSWWSSNANSECCWNVKRCLTLKALIMETAACLTRKLFPIMNHLSHNDRLLLQNISRPMLGQNVKICKLNITYFKRCFSYFLCGVEGSTNLMVVTPAHLKQVRDHVNGCDKHTQKTSNCLYRSCEALACFLVLLIKRCYGDKR